MEFGIFDHLDRGAGTLAQQYEDRLQLIEAYDRTGFFCYHLAEHHSTTLGCAPSPSVFLSAATQRSRRLRLAPLVYLLPFYHPLRLIEEICMLDQLSDGRLEIGTGRGIAPVEARFYGVDPAEGQRRYEEAFRILVEGLTHDRVTFAGEFYRFEGVPIVLEPVQKPHPPFWYGVHSDESAARAVKNGFHVITNEGEALAPAIVQGALDAWRAMGTAQPPPKIGLVRFFVIAADDDEARAIGERAYARWIESFYLLHQAYGYVAAHPKAATFAAAQAEGVAFAGTADRVARELGAQLDRIPANYVAGQFAFGDLTRDESLRTIESFARDVAPLLRGAAVSA